MTMKYSTDRDHRHLRDRDGGWVALTDHAIHRWQTRTPHDCPVAIRDAWERGEFIAHPQLAFGREVESGPIDARIYRHGDRWLAVFLVVSDATASAVRDYDAARVVCTIKRARRFEHEPTRAYLEDHQAHAHPDRNQR